MAQIPYVDSSGHVTVEVQLNHSSNVFLVNSINFQRYQSGESFSYYGGYYDHTPVKISVNESGRLYLIVDNGEEYRYRFY
ncbi:DUF1883 domain-containing protein [Clostridium sp. KNHs214]|uniref:DUF1883 domain-containing protein n=1 Tax=Clostridium sp. KNHs214 TaxID=1540257 RepID=UPI00054D058A|nr:DUF1883 domain-containing protein [Clostridium sp. KNHs214]